MKKKCKRLLDTIKKHTFYYRIMLPFSILSIVIVFVTALFGWHIISEKYEAEIKKSNTNILRLIQRYTDQYVFEEIVTVVNEKFMNEVVSSDIEQFYTYGKELQTSKMLGAYQSMWNICNNSPYIKQVTLYNIEDDLMLDTSYGLCYDASLQEQIINMSVPFSLYNKASSDSTNKYICLTSHNGMNNEGNSLALLRAIPLYVNFKQNTGYIAFGIDGEQLLSDLKYNYSLQGGFIILDDKGEPILETAEYDVNYDELKAVVDVDVNMPDATFDYGGMEFSLITVRSEISGWTYLYYVPKDMLNADSIATRHFVIMFAVLTVFFSILVIMVLSNRVYRPLRNLRDKFNIDLETAWAEDGGDIAAIQDIFSFLESKMAEMKDNFHQYKSVLEYKCLLDILYGNNISGDTIYKKLQLCGITFNESCFCLVIVEIEEVIFHMLSLEEKEYLSIRFQELINNWYGNAVIQMAERHPNNRIVALFNLNMMQYNKLMEEQQKLLNYLQDSLRISINIAVSECVERLDSVSQLYSKTCEYFKYSFIYNYGNVFNYKTNALFECNRLEIPLKEYQEMEYLVQNDNIEKFMQIVDQYTLEIYEKHYSYDSVNNFVMQLYGIVFRIGRGFRVFENAMDKKDKIIYEFNHAVNLTQSLECIYILLYIYRDLYHKKDDTSNVALIENIMNYIRLKCQEDITLVSVAEHFHISSGHLSRLFKSVRGENFSTFVVNVKMERAAQRLVEEKELSVNEIAESLGYYSPAYFTRLFKGKYGVTPTNYRKNKHVESNS